eukprot:c25180_g2_i1 orf=662-1228(+)
MARFIMHIIEHAVTVEDSYSPSGSHSNGSIGMLFVVLVVIIILGLLAGFLARICGGRHFAGNIEYDFEGWVERTCASCIDGYMPATGGGHTVPKAVSEGAAAPATKQTANTGCHSDALKSTDGKGGEKKLGGNAGGENKGGGKKGKGAGGRNKGGENKEGGTGAAEGGDKEDGSGETSGEKKEGEEGS